MSRGDLATLRRGLAKLAELLDDHGDEEYGLRADLHNLVHHDGGELYTLLSELAQAGECLEDAPRALLALTRAMGEECRPHGLHVLATLENPTGVAPCQLAPNAAARADVLRQVAPELLAGQKQQVYRTVNYGAGTAEVRALRLWNGTVQVFHRYRGGELIAQSLPGLPWLLAPWLN